MRKKHEPSFSSWQRRMIQASFLEWEIQCLRTDIKPLLELSKKRNSKKKLSETSEEIRKIRKQMRTIKKHLIALNAHIEKDRSGRVENEVLTNREINEMHTKRDKLENKKRLAARKRGINTVFWSYDKKCLVKWGIWVTRTNGYQTWETLDLSKEIPLKSHLFGANFFVDSKKKLKEPIRKLLKSQSVLSAVPKKIVLPVPERTAPPKNRRSLYMRKITEEALSQEDIDLLLEAIIVEESDN